MPAHQSLTETLKTLEATEANLGKAERLWARMLEAIPGGPAFGETTEYDNACRALGEVFEQMPRIDGFRPSAGFPSLNEIGQSRLDALEVGEIGAQASVEEWVGTPGRELAEYRFRFERKRRTLLRGAILEAIAAVDISLGTVEPATLDEIERPAAPMPATVLSTLRETVAQIETLLGSIKRPPRWGDLRRHLHFGQIGDLHDIVVLDWPEAKKGLEATLYGEDEPIPMLVADLADLHTPRAHEPVPTKLAWDRLTDEDFERLLFYLFRGDGYENPQWLTATRASDRGRDLSVTRVHRDRLSGTRRQRVIVQAKHWLSRSVSVDDLAKLREQMKLWEPPRVDVLILATSGRFTSDAVQWVEKHNTSDAALHIEMWAESHLEQVLAEQPSLIAEFNLR